MKYILTILSALIVIGFSFSQAQVVVPDPIVLIPGIGASVNNDVFAGKIPVQTPWKFSEGAKNYNNLVNELEIKGYVLNQTLFIAYYDWRKSSTDSVSNYLIPVINQAKQNSQSGKVDILAHSMGGLVARSYIQGNQYSNDVDQLFLLGTPNYGSSDAYGVWEGGRLPKHWPTSIKGEIGQYVWYLKLPNLFISDYDIFHSFFPSIKELLPVYDYVTDKDTQITKFTSNLNEQNPLLSWLNSETGIFDLQDRVSEITMVAGTGSSTVNSIPVVPKGIFDGQLWTDGRPDPLDPIPNDIGGDNTVLAWSAGIDFPYIPVPVKNDISPLQKWFTQFFTPAHAQSTALVNYYVVNSPHEELPTNAISHIFASLNLSAPTGQILPPYEPDAILSFWFASPVDVKVVDPDGKIITKDINEISDASYEATSDPLGPKFVTIPNPKNGEYKVELLGIGGGGGYHMGVSHIDDNSDVVNTIQGVIVTGQEIGYTINYDPINETTPADISEPYEIGEKTAIELVEELISDVDTYWANGLIKSVFAYKTLRINLVLVLNGLKDLQEFENDLVTNPDDKKLQKKVKRLQEGVEKGLKAFITQVNFYKKNKLIDPTAADDLISKTEKILQEISD